MAIRLESLWANAVPKEKWCFASRVQAECAPALARGEPAWGGSHSSFWGTHTWKWKFHWDVRGMLSGSSWDVNGIWCQPRINKPWFTNQGGGTAQIGIMWYLNGTPLTKQPGGWLIKSWYYSWTNTGCVFWMFVLSQIFPNDQIWFQCLFTGLWVNWVRLMDMVRSRQAFPFLGNLGWLGWWGVVVRATAKTPECSPYNHIYIYVYIYLFIYLFIYFSEVSTTRSISFRKIM